MIKKKRKEKRRKRKGWKEKGAGINDDRKE